VRCAEHEIRRQNARRTTAARLDLCHAPAATQLAKTRRFDQTADVACPTVSDDAHAEIATAAGSAAPPRPDTKPSDQPAIANIRRYWHSKATTDFGSIVVPEDQRLIVFRIGVTSYPYLADVAQLPGRAFGTARRDNTLQTNQLGRAVIGLQ
jgi:hypothetical protein